jgi:DNA-binding MarR family transcriptional regulator
MKGYAQAMSDSVDFCIADVASHYAAIDPAVEGVVDRVAAINKHIGRAFEETLADHGLSYGEYKLLLRLVTRTDDNRMSAGELSKSLMLSSGAMTNRLDQLEKSDLIRRVRDPKDRRGVHVELTPKGRTTIDQAVTEQAAKEIDVLGVLTPRELTTLNQLLRQVLGSLETRLDTKLVGDAAS